MDPVVVYVIAGLSLLLAAVLPTVLRRFAISPPMVLVGVGMLIGITPFTDQLSLDPVENRTLIQHVTEFTILVALMGVGLALDRPLSFRHPRTWLTWLPTWRLLAIGMPLSIAAVALLGWGVFGIAPAAALLLGAVLAPTDPVLASDVQVSGPGGPEGGDIGEDDEVRFSLTSEAGLNDGLAFPFVYAAMMAATLGSFTEWGLGWAAWELVGKSVIGVLAGIAVGWALAKVAFRARRPSLRLADHGEPMLVLAALLTAYGLSELVGGYGFLAVFACAMTMRGVKPDHSYHQAMHQVIERFERLATLIVLLALGMAMTNGLLANLDWRGITIGLALVFVIRPVTAAVSLLVGPRREDLTGMDMKEALVTAFFGVRGVGSIYYLAYAAGHVYFPEERWLWSAVAFTIILSVLVHGVTATPVMRRLDLLRKPAA